MEDSRFSSDSQSSQLRILFQSSIESFYRDSFETIVFFEFRCFFDFSSFKRTDIRLFIFELAILFSTFFAPTFFFERTIPACRNVKNCSVAAVFEFLEHRTLACRALNHKTFFIEFRFIESNFVFGNRMCGGYQVNSVGGGVNKVVIRTVSAICIEFFWRAFILLQLVHGILNELRSANIPLMPQDAAGCDGTFYSMIVGSCFGGATYNWWSQPPTGWEIVGGYSLSCREIHFVLVICFIQQSHLS